MKKPTETKEAEQFCIRGQSGDMLHSCLTHLKKIGMIFIFFWHHLHFIWADWNRICYFKVNASYEK